MREAHFVLVHVVALPFLVPARVTAVLFDKVADVDVLPFGCRVLVLQRFEQLQSVRRLAGPGRPFAPVSLDA